MHGRVLVMGDIHGNFRALEQCLERCNFDSEKDTLIQLGDLCDRHPESAKVVNRLLKVPKLISIRGNHDPWLEAWLETGDVSAIWSENGGIPTIESYIEAGDEIDRSDHIKFLKDQKNYYIDDDNRLFIHAGFTHEDGPEYENPVSNCYWDRSLWANAMKGRVSGQRPTQLAVFNEIYIGHTPTLNWQQDTPMQAFNVWNMDTGAGWNGTLTVMDIETKAYWQSDPANTLYN